MSSRAPPPSHRGCSSRVSCFAFRYCSHCVRRIISLRPEFGMSWNLKSMIFNIVHTTAYEYSAPAIESFTELRVRPRQSNRQIVHRHVTEVKPRAAQEEI